MKPVEKLAVNEEGFIEANRKKGNGKQPVNRKVEGLFL